MRKNFGPRPLAYPMPVFIIGSYNDDGSANAMNAAWGGISGQNEITLCISAGHKTAKNILAHKAFTVSMATEDHMAACDYLGLVSGNKLADKFSQAGFHAIKSNFVDAPIIEELPMAIECKMISFDQVSGRLVGEIINICADEKILNEDGNIDLEKLRPISFDSMNSTYHLIGSRVGNAFKDGGVFF